MRKRYTAGGMLAAALIFAAPASAQNTTGAAQTVKVGIARSLASVATHIAIEKGYFREVGINVEIQDLDSSADAMAILAQGGLNIIEGGVSAGYFNALDKKLPLTIVSDRTSSPIGHKLLVRNDLKDQIKSIADLKGRVTTTNGPGSIATYETAKILESAGLTIKDVDLRVMPFPNLAVAFENKAIDAALAILPWSVQLPDKGMAFEFLDVDDVVKPSPIQIAVNILNTDWATKNKDLAQRYFIAYQRGVRDYCQAYHHGPNRKEVIDIAVKTGAERRPEFLNTFPWPGRDVASKPMTASILDAQAWFRNNGLTRADLPVERLVDTSYVEQANSKLGPFELQNKASKLPSCR